jgi:Flp pilus assembly CpaF family ATPase
VEIWVYNQYNDQRETLKASDEQVTIGRDADNDVTLESPFVSRRHAKIVFENGSYFIECLGQNGLVVANHEVGPKQRGKCDFGDEIRIGEFSVYLMQPAARRVVAAERATSPRKRINDLEEAIHAQLLDQLNLRTTGQAGADEQFVSLIKQHLEDLIRQRMESVDQEMREYLLREYIWRSLVTELSRRATGKLMYSYGFEETDRTETKQEEQVSRIVQDIIGYFPLQLRPHTLKDDVALVEKDWQTHLDRIKARLTADLLEYVSRRMISKDIEDVVLGYGPLQDLLSMPNISEIMVVGKDKIYIEKQGMMQNTGRSFFSDQIVESVIERIITPIGRRLDRSQPLVDARLPDGSRVNAVIHPLSLSGPTLTIRKFAPIPFTIDDLIEHDTMTEQVAAFLRACVAARKNMMISGGTGSGKTTTLNVLSNFIPGEERIVTIEDSAELQLPQEHLVRLETRPANIEGKGAYTIRDLVRNALRMRPDRLIVGEVRGPEALDMLQAMNTGHDGSLSTIHANTPEDTMLRLETMVLMAVEMPIKAIREQIVAALDLVVQITRLPNGARRVTHVSEVLSIDPETDTIITEDIFVLRRRKGDPDKYGLLCHTGYLPAFVEELVHDGEMSIDVFT